MTGIVQLGLAFNNYLQLTDAVRAGARVATLSRSDPQAVVSARDAVVSAAPGLDAAELRSGTAVQSTWAAGSDVTVTASYPYTISIFGLDVYSGNLTSTTTARVE